MSIDTLKSVLEGVAGADDVPVPSITNYEQLGNYLRRREKHAKREAKLAREKALRRELKAREKENISDLFAKISDLTKNPCGGYSGDIEAALARIKGAVREHNASFATNANKH